MKTSPTKETPPTEEPTSKVTEEEEVSAPEVNGHAEEAEEKEEVKSEPVKEKEVESNSNGSADTEVKLEHSVDTTAHIQSHNLFSCASFNETTMYVYASSFPSLFFCAWRRP